MSTDQHPRSGRLALAVLSLALLALLATARSSDAGSYVVNQCSPHTSGAGSATWASTTGHYAARDRCADGGGLQAYHAADETAIGNYGAWVWRAPAGTVFTNVQANASLTNQAGHHGELWVERTDGQAVEFGWEHNDFLVHSLAGEFRQFHAWLRCAAPGATGRCGRAGDDGAHAYVRGVFLRTDDRTAPAIALGGGSLLAAPVVRGVRGLEFAATDAGGGVRKVYVQANGVVTSTDLRNCALAGGFATALTPCPPSTSESALVNTALPAFATGPNTVLACVEDLALDGAPNTACEQRQVWVDNACPASAIGGGTQLSAGFAGGSPATGTARSDRRGVINGEVSGAGGAIAGATVCALTQVDIDGAPIVVGATTVSESDGSYSLELPPGPSRQIFVHYVSGDQVVARHGLALAAVARPTLRVKPRHRARRGTRLAFEGELPAGACFDRVVKIQARIGKQRWQVFRTDRADRGCRFAGRYKLRATGDARVYRFRALVPEQSGYPYLRGASAVAKVEVRRR